MPLMLGEGKASCERSHLTRTLVEYILEMSQGVKGLPDPKPNIQSTFEDSLLCSTMRLICWALGYREA